MEDRKLQTKNGNYVSLTEMGKRVSDGKTVPFKPDAKVIASGTHRGMPLNVVKDKSGEEIVQGENKKVDNEYIEDANSAHPITALFKRPKGSVEEVTKKYNEDVANKLKKQTKKKEDNDTKPIKTKKLIDPDEIDREGNEGTSNTQKTEEKKDETPKTPVKTPSKKREPVKEEPKEPPLKTKKFLKRSEIDFKGDKANADSEKPQEDFPAVGGIVTRKKKLKENLDLLQNEVRELISLLESRQAKKERKKILKDQKTISKLEAIAAKYGKDSPEYIEFIQSFKSIESDEK